jgi:PKD repeat protein/uncharacterized membrane protein YphA (DoxX/SURF4 family)
LIASARKAKIQWFLIGLRIVLGMVFVLASVSKLPVQSQFIADVASYGLLPHNLSIIWGTALPWVELLAGCCLILGAFTSLTLAFCGLMTISFITANIFALSKGIVDNCGCFGLVIPLSHTASLTIDILMILSVIVLSIFRKQLSFSSIYNLISRFIPKNRGEPGLLTQKIFQVVIILIFVTAIGVPYSLSGDSSPVFAEIDRSLSQGKPVFLYFYLPGCGECEKQDPIIDEFELKYRNDIRFIRVDFQKEAGVAVKFEVKRTPTMLLVDKQNDKGYALPKRFVEITNETSLRAALYEALATLPISKTQEPIAEFTASSLSGHSPAEVRFTDSSLGDIRNWDWDFNNDGNPDSSLQNPTYVFNSPGNYTVSLKVSGPFGSSTETKPACIHLTSEACKADFYAVPTLVQGPIPVQFQDQSEGDIISWEWDFTGDGKIESTERNPTYLYKDGNYSVTLTVKTNKAQDTLTREDYISVSGCG